MKELQHIFVPSIIESTVAMLELGLHMCINLHGPHLGYNLVIALAQGIYAMYCTEVQGHIAYIFSYNNTIIRQMQQSQVTCVISCLAIVCSARIIECYF